MPENDDRFSLSDESCPEDPDEPLHDWAGTCRWLLLLTLGSWVVPILLAILLKGG